MDWREQKPSQRVQLEGFFQSPGKRQRKPVQGSERKNREQVRLREDFCCQNDLELVVIYDVALFSYGFVSSLGANTVSDSSHRFVSLSLMKSGLE